MNFNFQIKIKKRFYIFVGFLLCALGFIWFSDPEISSKPDPSILAATVSSFSDSSVPELIEAEDNSSLSGTGSENDIASYQPVTISHTVEEGDTLQSIASTYHADPQTIVDYPPNEIGENITLSLGQVLIIPNGYIDTPPPIIPVAKGSGIFSWPTKGVISQYAFWWHPGAIDIANSIGTPIYSAYSGRIIKVENFTTGYGKHVVVEHTDGYTTLYAHMLDINVVVGQTVNQGTRLGSIGSTGRSTGPHLHFEVRKNGEAVDPMTLLPSKI
jgi:murein DD-endopeptidase MepM/ murein hydrolase activator NlpD